MLKIIVIIGLICLYPLEVISQFVNVSAAQLGVSNVNWGTIYGDGVSFYDFNDDGHDDLTIPNGTGSLRFYLNNNGQYQQVVLNITNQGNKVILMVLWADYDNDGDEDLLVTRDDGTIQLWRNNGDLIFENVAAAAGLEQGNYHYWGAAFADYDHDGCLDLFVAKYYNGLLHPGVQYRSLLYRSNCDGTFTEVTMDVGIDVTPNACFQPVFLDYDNDGWEDLYLVIDRILFSNELFRNNGDGTFSNVTVSTGLNQYICSMSGTIGDYDNDLDDDIYVANSIPGNLLMKNNNGANFSDVAVSHGVAVNQICWGSMWLDYDNNSWQDLIVSITFPYLTPIGNQLYINENGQGFSNGTAISGFANDPTETHQVAMGDFNEDGYYDFVRSNRPPYPAQLFQNMGGENHFLSVSLEGVFANRDGIGSRIHCYAGGQHYIRYTHCGENFTSQNSGKKIFGLGEIQWIDSLVVMWNSGTIDRFYDFQSDWFMNIREGDSDIQPFSITSSSDFLLCEGESIILDAGEHDSYDWSNGEQTRFVEVSEPGLYYVDVTNAFGTVFTSDSSQVSWSDISDGELVIEQISCADFSDGKISLEISEEVLVSMEWSTGSDSLTIENLAAGEFTYQWTDIQSCVHIGSVEIFQPEAIVATALINNITCAGLNNGTAILNISGGTAPFMIDWLGEDSLALTSGWHSCAVTDANGCFFAEEFYIDEPELMIIELALTPVSCAGGNDGMAQLTVEGGVSPYAVNWNDLDPLSMSSGTQTVAIQDANGCIVESSFDILEPNALECTLNTFPQTGRNELGSALISIEGGTFPYTIHWSTGLNDSSYVDQLIAGAYSVSVTDVNGCICNNDFTIDFVNLIVGKHDEGFRFYPNPADEFILLDGFPDNFNLLEICDLSGQVVYFSTGLSRSQQISTKHLSNGMYFIRLNFDNYSSTLPLLIYHD